MVNATKSRTGELLYGTAGLILTGWALLTMPAGWWVTALLTTALIAVITPYSIRLNDPIRLPAAMPVEMLLMLVAPPQVSILAAAVTNLVTSIWYRRPPVRTLFNVANLAVPNALSILVLALALRPWPHPLRLPWDLAPVLLAVAVRMTGNMAGQAVLQSLQGTGRFWPALGRSWSEELRTGGAGLRLLPVLMALAYPSAGWWALPAGVLVQVSLGASLRRFQERIERQTLTDGLTNVGNRKAWQLFRGTAAAGGPCLVAVIDVDGLKAANDSRGHERGDAVLVDIASRLNLAVRDGRIFRMGGDEFLVVLPAPYPRTTIRAALEETMDAFGEAWQSQDVPVSASFGFAACPDEAPDLDSAMALADQRMYAMKADRSRRERVRAQ
jgi:diguanylate cyclase (GGDEF)-like protein